ncbi:hypothetical protein [Fimbriimonas ginsengisoli]|uniref:Uncharacterized protein n=1 Tax=Fimbriimonas ginsengisoli Gsoil 348 TaxID=661478 RepID=A0A068NWF3_FIMGI|nr:hypothetical protein [Fimbriimonas ginsengisoli]AIE87070.1 hypothetical protein OP10G_3702 [Fimbriimonas ginsengisoli Gsoil 348]
MSSQVRTLGIGAAIGFALWFFIYQLMYSNDANLGAAIQSAEDQGLAVLVLTGATVGALIGAAAHRRPRNF